MKDQENNSQTVLVVGGAGYIGSHVARALQRHGYGVIVYDNLSTGRRFLAKGFELIEADIADNNMMRAALKRVDAVMHFAAHAYVGESVKNPRKYFANNVEAALKLLNEIVDSRVRHIVFSSSCAVYGASLELPITEDAVRQPINPYGSSKLFFESALEAYAAAYGLRYGSLRYFNAAGADEGGEIGEVHDPETHVIPLALQATAGEGPELRIFGGDYPTVDGTCVRDYIHVNDLAEAHVLALRRLMDESPSFALNLGTGEGTSVMGLIRTVESVTGRRVRYAISPPRQGDAPILIADPRRAHKVLNWRAQRTLHDIVSTAWQWKQRVESTAEPVPHDPALDCCTPSPARELG